MNKILSSMIDRLSSRMKTVLENQLFHEDEEYVRFLEKYLIIPSKLIADAFNVSLFDSYLKNQELSVNIPRSIDCVPVGIDDEGKIIVTHNMYTSINPIALDTACPNFDFVLKPTLPYAYERLKADYLGLGEDKDWDYFVILQLYLIDIISNGGTDVHFICKHDGVGFRYYAMYRSDSPRMMKESTVFPMSERLHVALIKYIVDKKTNIPVRDLQMIAPSEASILDVFGDGSYSLRVTVNRCLGGFQFVGRLQDPRNTSRTIEELGFSEDVESVLKLVAAKENGLTLITGPMNVGKNVTAYSLLKEIGKRPIKVVEYSNPVENYLPIVQVPFKDNEDLKALLSTAKKQDIDIAFVSEIPDKGVAEGIFDLVNSSVGVIATTHLDRVWRLPAKLREFFGDNFKAIIGQLNCVFNQRLFTQLCPECREQVSIDDFDDLDKMVLEDLGLQFVYTRKGCKHCNNGLMDKGLKPVGEYFIFSDDAKDDLLRLDKVEDMELYIKKHMEDWRLEITLTEYLREGIIDFPQYKRIM